MKYFIVEDVTESLEDLKLVKVRLTADPGLSETPWAKELPDGRQVLQNNAVNFYPFASWGLVIPSGYEHDVTELREAKLLPIHKEAWDAMIEREHIDAEGNWIAKEENKV